VLNTSAGWQAVVAAEHLDVKTRRRASAGDSTADRSARRARMA